MEKIIIYRSDSPQKIEERINFQLQKGFAVKFINTISMGYDLIVTVVYKDNQNNEQKELLC